MSINSYSRELERELADVIAELKRYENGTSDDAESDDADVALL